MIFLKLWIDFHFLVLKLLIFSNKNWNYWNNRYYPAEACAGASAERAARNPTRYSAVVTEFLKEKVAKNFSHLHSLVLLELKSTRVQWNLVSNKIPYNLLRYHFVVRNVPWIGAEKWSTGWVNNKESLNENPGWQTTKRISTKTLLYPDAHEWNQTLCYLFHLSLLNKNDRRLKINDYDNLTCTCYSCDKWQEGQKQMIQFFLQREKQKNVQTKNIQRFFWKWRMETFKNQSVQTLPFFHLVICTNQEKQRIFFKSNISEKKKKKKK